MKNIAMILLALFTAAGISPAQGTYLLFGAEGFAAFPMGNFSKRMNPSTGFSFSVREAHYNQARWGGFFEYAKYNDENRDKLFIKRKDTLNNVPRDLVFPLKPFDMSFTAYGAGVTANYNILSTPIVDLNGTAGFGIYYWKFERASYFDSVKVDTGTVSPRYKLIDLIQVPQFQQQDWSGGIEIGAEADIVVFSPFILSASARYKVILAELWPALDLDMENVSGIQSAYFTVGVKYLIE